MEWIISFGICLLVIAIIVFVVSVPVGIVQFCMSDLAMKHKRWVVGTMIVVFVIIGTIGIKHEREHQKSPITLTPIK